MATREEKKGVTCTTKQARNHCKALIIEQGLDKEVAKASRLNFANGDRSALEALESVYGVPLVKLSKQVTSARYKRKLRVQDRVSSLVSNGICLFLTLTFTDEVLSKTSEKTRRRYVGRFLKSQTAVYVANIDYGGKKGREHYHALALASNIDYSAWHCYGAIKGEVVKTTQADCTKVCKYVAKLSNHAMKFNDGVAPRLIYSREKEAIKELFKDLF